MITNGVQNSGKAINISLESNFCIRLSRKGKCIECRQSLTVYKIAITFSVRVRK